MTAFALRLLSCVFLVTAAAFAQTELLTNAELVDPEQLARLKDTTRPRPILLTLRSRFYTGVGYRGL